MIEISGNRHTPEYAAALEIAGSLEANWPGITDSPADEDSVKIHASAKLSGYKVSDVDIIVAARFSKKRYIVPKAVFADSDSNKVLGQKVLVQSFVAAIEVKDHDASRIKTRAGNVLVEYKDGWKSATDQNDAQRYALLSYLKDYLQESPWVYRCIILRGIDALPSQRGKPEPESGAVAAGFNAASLLMAMAMVNGVKRVGSEYVIRAGNHGLIDKVLSAPVFKEVMPSRLDRKRMDRIASRPALAVELSDLLGEKRVHLKGKGGTGKTVLLLQAAHDAFERLGKRTIVLTYNHALAADIQRLVALMGIPAISEDGGIEIRTVMSFMYSWFSRLGLLEEGHDADFGDYERLCSEALSLIEGGAISEADMENAKASIAGGLGFDSVIVDESQDWPQAEAALLCKLYGGETVAIADGEGQLVRGRPTDWAATIGRKRGVGFHNLETCLRMKRNLAVFANVMAGKAGLSWNVGPSTEAAGGRVIVASGPYAGHAGLRASLVQSTLEAGNSPVDMLHCVPPNGVALDGNRRTSYLSKAFLAEGKECWDGVDAVLRQDFPRSVSEFRIVQYESCRGLEGWVTVLDGLDAFWESKRDEFLMNSQAHAQGMELSSPDIESSRFAWRWVLIALTRPIDTLVITLHNPQSHIANILEGLAGEMPDIVEAHNPYIT